MRVCAFVRVRVRLRVYVRACVRVCMCVYAPPPPVQCDEGLCVKGAVTLCNTLQHTAPYTYDSNRAEGLCVFHTYM